ncbi:MAG: hypothetical protein NVS4B8_25680 [Herpetosiphon sp.]
MEVERKWRLSAPVTVFEIEAINWSPFRLTDRQLLRQVNHYFDTPDFALRQAQHSLRLRDENDQLFLTLKKGGTVKNGLHEREEIERPTSSAEPAEWPAEIMELVAEIIGDKQLESFLRIINGRQAWQVFRDDVVIGELAMDSGTIYAGDRRESILELEWEFRGGSRPIFDEMARLIEEHLPLEASNVTKLARGIALLSE